MRCRRAGLLLWVIASSGLAGRDLWLAAHGGGATPGWLLRAETGLFGIAALSGVVELASSWSTDPDQTATHTAWLATATGTAAITLHGVRLVLYLAARRARRGTARHATS